MHSRFRYTILFVCVTLAACGDADGGGVFGVTRPPTDSVTTRTLTEAQVRTYFLDVVFARHDHVLKWQGPIRVSVSGGTAADQQDAAAFLAELRDLTGQDIAIVAADPNFEIRFLARSAGSLWVAGGWSASNGVIVRGSVNVDSDLAPAARRGALRQLFLMAMGLGRPAEAYPESIFALETTGSGLSWYDREVVRRFYQPAVLPNMSRPEVAALLGY